MHQLIVFCCLLVTSLSYAQHKNFAIVIHGGAGTILREKMTPELEKQYMDKLQEALNKGYDTLNKGGTGISAVVETIKILEDSPLFNAGKGSVFTADGKNEMDAAIMDGKTKDAGAVAGLRHIKNPITAALCVMLKSDHVFLTAKGAEEFAKTCNCETVDTSYFFDQKRWDQLQQMKENERRKLSTGSLSQNPDHKFGTVGVVVLDRYGNLAAGTSTGGMTNKKYGRIGDSPIIGAGTYADNESCAVSCTGHGEYFIRNVVAYDLAVLVKYMGIGIDKAAHEIIHEKLKKQGGEGGLIAIDKKGNITMTFNTSGMYRGYKKSDGTTEIKIFK